MYQAHWNLQETPFSGRNPKARFFASPTHDEALARLHFLVDERRRLGLLLGPAGSGKTLVLELLAKEAARSGNQTARVNLLGIGEYEFLFQLAQALGLFPAASQSLAATWRAIADRLAEHRCQKLQTLLLLDDADEAPIEALEQVVRLAQLDTGKADGLTIVLAAATHRLSRLGRRLLSLADLRVDLEPWTAEDTAQFITDALARCGRDEPIFDGHAVLRLHELTQGSPRGICQLADLCLLVGAAQGLTSIDETTVETVSQELGVHEICLTQRVG